MMRVVIALVVCIGLSFDVSAQSEHFGNGANSFSLEFVAIGNPGNLPDLSGSPNSAGGVSYQYWIGKYEISEDAVRKASQSGGLGIVIDARGPNKPATSISWLEAARFVNWLNTSSGSAAAYKFLGETFSIWLPSDPGYDPANGFRNKLARYTLPSMDEWYKAAFHDSTAGTQAVYFDFATGGSPPLAVASGTASGTAVYAQTTSAGPANVAEAGGSSSYGTVAQGGNVYEWEETGFNLVNDGGAFRGTRGGAWDSNSQTLSALSRGGIFFNREYDSLGFRVVSHSLPGSCPCSDLNRDGLVDGADVSALYGNWGNSGLGDVVPDGIVDGADLAQLFGTWTGDAGNMLVPEWSNGAVMFVLAGIAMRFWRF